MKRKFVTIDGREIMAGDAHPFASRVSTYEQHLAPKDPRGTGQYTGERTWLKSYEKEDWREEFMPWYDVAGAEALPRGSLGVINDDMSEIENLLANESRAGGMRKDGQPDMRFKMNRA